MHVRYTIGMILEGCGVYGSNLPALDVHSSLPSNEGPAEAPGSCSWQRWQRCRPSHQRSWRHEVAGPHARLRAHLQARARVRRGGGGKGMNMTQGACTWQSCRRLQSAHSVSS